jgi:cardiolipin synthase
VKPRDIPNLITILRILLVIPMMLLLARGEYWVVLGIFAFAGLSDGLDGYLARRFNWRTPLGALLDPLADKLMLVGVYLVLGGMGMLPAWLVGLVVLRDVVIISGALAYRRRCGDLTMAPTWISKANTLFQIVLGLVAILSTTPAGDWLPPWSLNGLIGVVTLTTLWSGMDYVWCWGQRAHRCRRQEEKE